jgi:pyruvate formate lyase activating enzyme
MDIPIKGIIEASLLEWAGKISTVCFLPYCNFKCPFCHTVTLVEEPDKLETISVNKAKEIIKKNRRWIDGITITGGEPTIYKDLPEFIKNFTKDKLAVKLETNGSNPEMIKDLIKNNLIHSIAMDIKTSLSKYKQAIKVEIDTSKIEKSIDIIMNSDIDYEFRTTMVPEIVDEKDIKEITALIKGAEKYFLQQFRNKETLDGSLKNLAPYSMDKLKKMVEDNRKMVKKMEIR